MSFQDNINIWKNTVEKAKSLQFRPPKSIKYDYLDIQPETKYEDTYVNVFDLDSIHIGYLLKKRGFNPVVLNMADDCFPGGHVQIGSGAQEESLFRRSNYFQTLNLETGFYPLVDSQLVYSPNVTIIKDNEGNNLNPLNYFNLCFIACPAIKKPDLINGKYKDEDRKLMIRKIRNILNVAYYNGHDTVVLGALGCGAWECPQEETALLFKKAIKDYLGVFKSVNFAILEVDKHQYIVKNRNHERSNYRIFEDIFYKSNSS